ncbi:serine/threonine protein kinase [Plakobranchus ocellatus]|uniref:Serine/threonine protein kinase n=1 Tax=Plakobranchus ocellatus TaxID=259542 RepID=A0AAV4A1D4_9GAST|nr:serine/threonine protein kinase [Plakobranchus ocellatus]
MPCVIAARCPGYAALTMPYYPQGALAFLSSKKPPAQVHCYMTHVARGLYYLHRRNIAHNDLKLENVFVDAQKRAHLGDLGLTLKVKAGSRNALPGCCWVHSVLLASTGVVIWHSYKDRTFQDE